MFVRQILVNSSLYVRHVSCIYGNSAGKTWFSSKQQKKFMYATFVPEQVWVWIIIHKAWQSVQFIGNIFFRIVLHGSSILKFWDCRAVSLCCQDNERLSAYSGCLPAKWLIWKGICLISVCVKGCQKFYWCNISQLYPGTSDNFDRSGKKCPGMKSVVLSVFLVL